MRNMEGFDIEQELSLYKKELLEFQNMSNTNYLLFFLEKEGISRVKKIAQLSEKIHSLEMRNLSKKSKNDANIGSLFFPVILYPDNQYIQIGDNTIRSFKSLFKVFSENNKNVELSQLKAGISLIYSIAKMSNGKEMKRFSIKSLIAHFEGFRKEWNNWNYSNRGRKREGIGDTDCLRAKQILEKYDVYMTLDISPDTKEILLKKVKK